MNEPACPHRRFGEPCISCRVTLNTAAGPRGVITDYCPTCGNLGRGPCRSPLGRAVPDHKDRAPECNGQGPGKCNRHDRGCPTAQPSEDTPASGSGVGSSGAVDSDA